MHLTKSRRRPTKLIKSLDGNSKVCSSCKIMKLLSEYSLSNKISGKLHYECKGCHAKANSILNIAVKKEVFLHYCNGNVSCTCCNEKELIFLTIDHIDNDGASHRKSGITSGTAFYYWLRRNKYPNGFQVLCWNCQHSKYVEGICFHQRKNKII